MKPHLVGVLLGCALLLAPRDGVAFDEAADKGAIENAAVSYSAAFNARDLKKLAEHWGPDGVYINPVTGEQFEGRDAIVKGIEATLAAAKELKLDIQIESIQFLSPSVALEQGTATVVSSGETPVVSRYSALHVKRDGKWLLDRVQEQEENLPPSNYDKLKELEWMIGTWVDEDENAVVETVCQWTKNQAFITRAFTVSVGDHIDMSGMQIIGWDANAGRIRSWVFDSDGGFGEATWTKKDNRWTVNAAGTLPDGRRTSAVNVLTMIDQDTISWQATGRSVGGEILPNIEPVKLKRQAAVATN